MQTGARAHPASLSIPRQTSPWVKRPGPEADHSTPSSVQFRNAWRSTSTSYSGGMGWRNCWGTALQAGRSRVRFPMLSLEYHSGHNTALGSTRPLTDMSTRNISWRGGKSGRCVRLTALSPLCTECLEIWEPQPRGVLRTCNRPAQGLC